MLYGLLLACVLLGAALVLYVLSTFLLLLLRQVLSPLRHLRGPASPSFFMGNLREMHDQENTNLIARWQEQHGSTFVYRGFMGGVRLMTTDPVAVAHILGRGYDYPKPDFVRDNLSNMAAGEHGLLTVEGEDHRRQVRPPCTFWSPAFTSAHIKSLSPIFWVKAVELRDIWLDIASCSQSRAAPSDPFYVAPPQPGRAAKDDLRARAFATTTSALPNPFSSFVPGKTTARRQNRSASTAQPDSAAVSTSDDGPTRVDVLAWLARATLDVIGEAGFGYEFNSLTSAARRGEEKGGETENELARAFGVIFSAARKFRVITVLQAWFPGLRRFSRESAAQREARETMRRIGLSLIEQRHAEATKEQAATLRGADAHLKQQPATEHTTDGRDLLSVLIRSNLSSVPSQRLSLEETLCQISTFLSAGHETSSSALTWTLYALARAPNVQARLRRELAVIPLPVGSLVSGSPPPADTIAAILDQPYLDAVVRESLRLHAPVTSTMRVVGVDDVVPVSRPFFDRHGRTCDAIRMRKGDMITVSIQAMNKSREVWGEDAEVFRPERWLLAGEKGEDRSDDEDEGEDEKVRREGKPGRGQKKAGAPGLWGNMLTFGNGNPVNGNRACIGFRFAINEIKIFLYVLLHDVDFSIDPTVEIEKKVNVVTRPAVKSEPHMGNQMPLNIRRRIVSEHIV
ncbi:cytochrome P450 [Fomitopsis serialis]|uniref:cytochrome P450 n=1 Tax=Fomitopsis serialis TaxID=139415 RepID=UPI0020076664|nr:cytochrome P450 [Neoantrodia serialis]KAH9922636.1 cytochrome P450 [Neoantrodia serialis]